jgi:hypothetical protein
MAIDFPTSPAPGQQVTSGSRTWTWSGTYWANNTITGVQGTQGIQGTQGTQGVQGIQGLLGTQGSQGLQGIQGIQGITGAQGIQGIQGTQGTQGLQGIMGAQGAQGTQGTQGAQGIQGTQGTQGLQGITGAQGISGASILGTANTWTNTNAFTTLSASSYGTTSFSVATGSLASFPVAQGLYSYYSAGGVIGAYSDNAGTRASLTLDGSSIAIRPAGSTVGTFTSTGLGIGTTSPNAKLEVVGAASVTSFTGSTALGFRITGATSTNDYSGIDFSSSTAIPRARIGSYFAGGGSYLVFGTSNNYSTGITNSAMTIDYSGNVGIGTTAPLNKLDVYGDGIRLSNSGTYDAILRFDYDGVSSDSFKFQTVTHNTAATGLATQMVIKQNGNVGIGTTSPAYRLDVQTSSEYQISWTRTSSSKTWAFGSDSLGTYFANRTDSILPMYITNAGNVGIGTSSPSYKLHVAGDIYSSGTITEASSITLKENLNPITDALDVISSLQGWIYDRKDGTAMKQAGFIAEEVEQVLPNVVSKTEDGTPMGVQYTKIIAYLVESVKELKAQIEVLKK